MSFASDVVPKASYAGALLHIVRMGDHPLGLMGRDETNADHGAAARTAECRQRGFGLSERRHESETISLRHAPLALGAAKLATIKLGVRRL